MASAADEPSITEQLARRLSDRLQAIKLKVVILGPGLSADEFGKRDAVRRFLETELFPTDRIFYPEDIIPNEWGATFGFAPAEVELLLHEDPDLILALFPPGSGAESLYLELVHFAQLGAISERVRIFRADTSVEAWSTGYRGNHVEKLYDIGYFIDYPAASWASCDYIRPRALALAQRIRERRMNIDLLREQP